MVGPAPLIRHLHIVSSEIASAELRVLFPPVAEKQSHGLPGPLCNLRVLGFSQQCAFPYFLEEETNETSASLPLSNTVFSQGTPPFDRDLVLEKVGGEELKYLETHGKGLRRWFWAIRDLFA